MKDVVYRFPESPWIFRIFKYDVSIKANYQHVTGCGELSAV